MLTKAFMCLSCPRRQQIFAVHVLTYELIRAGRAWRPRQPRQPESGRSRRIENTSASPRARRRRRRRSAVHTLDARRPNAQFDGRTPALDPAVCGGAQGRVGRAVGLAVLHTAWYGGVRLETGPSHRPVAGAFRHFLPLDCSSASRQATLSQTSLRVYAVGNYIFNYTLQTLQTWKVG